MNLNSQRGIGVKSLLRGCLAQVECLHQTSNDDIGKEEEYILKKQYYEKDCKRLKKKSTYYPHMSSHLASLPSHQGKRTRDQMTLPHRNGYILHCLPHTDLKLFKTQSIIRGKM